MIDFTTAHAVTDSFFELVRKVTSDMQVAIDLFDAGKKEEALEEAGSVIAGIVHVANDPRLRLSLEYLFTNKDEEKEFDSQLPIQ